MKKGSKYNYKKLTITFDLDYDEEKEMIEWMEGRKAKKVNFNTLIKDGLRLLIKATKKKEENVVEGN